MKNRTSLILILILCLLTSSLGQTSVPTPQQEPVDEDEVVRITSNLVQVDAIVTDKSGRQVTDLRPEDFEILEDGKEQAITNFSYVTTGAEATISRPAAPMPGTVAAPVMPARLRPEQVRRTIVLVADDLGLSFESTIGVRKTMKKFVDEKVQPGDLVAIARTSTGMGALQQLTTNKQQLYAAIERLRWSTDSRVGTSSFGPGSQSIIPQLKKPVGYSLDALGFIIKGLKGLPGRKSVVLFSDDFVVFPTISDIDLKLIGEEDEADAENIQKKLEELMTKGAELDDRKRATAGPDPRDSLAKLLDQANQASVVIYTVDTRGLPIMGINAVARTQSNPMSAIASDSLKLFNTQVGLRFVAEQTGGFAITNNNDIDGGIGRVLDDLKGYYLIGYRPAEGTFGRGRFHKISVRVKRPGLTVRSRKGFYGLTEQERRAKPRTRSEELLAAMTSPFQSGNIDLRLTSLFGNNQAQGSFMRSLLHLDANALKFQTDSEGWQTAKIEIAAMTFNDAGKIVDQVAREETIQVRGGSYQRLLRNGMVYSFDVPVKKPGSYQLRVGVRDPATKFVGAASQFIEVPDLAKSRLTLSGIYAHGVDPAATRTQIITASSQAGSGGGLLSGSPQIGEAVENEPDVQPGATIRRLRRGMALDYSFSIFNPQVEKSTRRPQLQTRIILFRNGEQVLAKNVNLIDPANQVVPKRFEAVGRLDLDASLAPGEYILQVIVTDLLADEKYRTATQWIDFEIVK
jgi:VWFA-related protein